MIDFLAILNSIWQILVVGLLFGAGLPAIFALGMRSLTAVPAGYTIDPSSEEPLPTTTGGRIGAYVCFGLCVLFVLVGIAIIVWGNQIFGSSH
jgi:hypothetical protein